MNKETMISVAVATYNHEMYIRHALDSILAQETQYVYEIVVGDDCSVDHTREILKEYEKQYPDIIRVIYGDTNVGPTKNVFNIVSNCRGKYIAYLDGDDYYTDNNKIEKQVSFLETNPTYKSCAHRLEIVDKNEHHLIYTLSDLNLDCPMDGRFYSKYNTDMLHLNSLLFVNIFKDDPERYAIIYESNKWSCHSLFLLFCLQLSDIYVFSESMTAWRFVSESGGTNYTSQLKEKRLQFNEDKLALYRAEKDYFGNTIPHVDLTAQLVLGYLSALEELSDCGSDEYAYWKRKYSLYLNRYEKNVLAYKLQINRVLKKTKVKIKETIKRI